MVTLPSPSNFVLTVVLQNIQLFFPEFEDGVFSIGIRTNLSGATLNSVNASGKDLNGQSTGLIAPINTVPEPSTLLLLALGLLVAYVTRRRETLFAPPAPH